MKVKPIMIFVILVLFALLVFTGCTLPASNENSGLGDVINTLESDESPPSDYIPPDVDVVPEGLLGPENLVYVGAFRLPDGREEYDWAWGGAALTFYPDGDQDGPDDGFSGSLYGVGHAWNSYISEVSIPEPVLSGSKNLEELPTAGTLQEFQDIRAGLFEFLDFEITRVALEYLPPQEGQTTGKLHFAWGDHYQANELDVTHGWAELDLSNPQTAGAWYLGDFNSYATNDYLFAIPTKWADRYTPGMLLATGRYRDGGWSGMGPSLYAYGPWMHGDPPAPGTHLQAVPLLQYDTTLVDLEGETMNDYHHSDEWNGGAWLTAGEKTAVIFVGTKGVGECWYGFGNGVVWPDEGPFPEVPEYPFDARGWWSTGFVGQIIFYDPADLARVALGEMESYEPQPYAVMLVDDYLFGIESTQQLHHLGAVAYDRENNYLYILELFGDGDKPLVHVWQVVE